jgi:hypothetical protein
MLHFPKLPTDLPRLLGTNLLPGVLRCGGRTENRAGVPLRYAFQVLRQVGLLPRESALEPRPLALQTLAQVRALRRPQRDPSSGRPGSVAFSCFIGSPRLSMIQPSVDRPG